VAGFTLLVLLPTRAPGATIESLVVDIGHNGSKTTSRRALYRLIADLRAAGFQIESEVLPNGKRGHFVTGITPDLMRKLGLGP